MSSVRVLEKASGGHVQFQLASLSKVRKHTVVKDSFYTSQAFRILSVPPLEELSKFTLNWECGETFEGLVREACQAVTSMCFKLGILPRRMLTHQLISRHVDMHSPHKLHRYAFTTMHGREQAVYRRLLRSNP